MRTIIIDSQEFTERNVEALKAGGKYFEAGILTRLLGLPRKYGCHVGMRSTLERDREAFYCGFDRK